MSLSNQIINAGEENMITIIKVKPASTLVNFRVHQFILSGSCSELFHVPDDFYFLAEDHR